MLTRTFFFFLLPTHHTFEETLNSQQAEQHLCSCLPLVPRRPLLFKSSSSPQLHILSWSWPWFLVCFFALPHLFVIFFPSLASHFNERPMMTSEAKICGYQVRPLLLLLRKRVSTEVVWRRLLRKKKIGCMQTPSVFSCLIVQCALYTSLFKSCFRSIAEWWF